MKKKFSKSIRKYVCREKSQIRREVFNLKEQEKQIEELIRKNYGKIDKASVGK